MEFADFYAANYRDLTVQLYAYCGSMSDAQDVVQEACCRALADWPRLSGYDDPAGWVRRVAWNLATSNWRRNRRLSVWTPCARTDTSPGPAPDHVDLVAALARLPWRQRQAMVLHYLGDVSVEEIALISNVPAGTVKSWMSRARAALSARLTVAEAAVPAPSGKAPRGGNSGGMESFAPAVGGQAARFTVGVADELETLFDDLRETASPAAIPGVAKAYRTVAGWRRLNRR